MTDKFKLIRYIYLYLVTVITIVVCLISTIGLVKMGLNELLNVKGYQLMDYSYQCSDDTLFFQYNPDGTRVKKYPNAPQTELDKKKIDCTAEAEKKAAEQESNDKKRQIVEYIAMFIVALPLYLYHWGIIKKENKTA